MNSLINVHSIQIFSCFLFVLPSPKKNFLYYPLTGVFQRILKNLKNSFSYRTSPAIASAVIQMDCPTILFLLLCAIFHYNSSFVFTTFQLSFLEISPKKTEMLNRQKVFQLLKLLFKYDKEPLLESSKLIFAT